MQSTDSTPIDSDNSEGWLKVFAVALEHGAEWGITFVNDPRWEYDCEKMSNHAIYESTMWSLGSGVATGLFGFFGLPADLVNTIYSQVKLASALFTINGFDMDDDATVTLAIMAGLGVTVHDFVKQFGTQVLIKASESLIQNMAVRIATSQTPKLVSGVLLKLPRPILIKIISTISGKSLTVPARVIPLIGGLVSGGVNAGIMNASGHGIVQYIKVIKSRSF